jgi:hypothetical protein
VKAKAMTSATARRSRLFGQPLLLEGEDPAADEEFRARLKAAIKIPRSPAVVTRAQKQYSACRSTPTLEERNVGHGDAIDAVSKGRATRY